MDNWLEWLLLKSIAFHNLYFRKHPQGDVLEGLNVALLHVNHCLLLFQIVLLVRHTANCLACFYD